MLQRIKELVNQGEFFAFETTLSTKSYRGLIKKAEEQGYEITLLFLILDSVQLAIQRVRTRVKEGGHDIPIETIKRWYSSGLINFSGFIGQLLVDGIWLIIQPKTSNLLPKGLEMQL